MAQWINHNQINRSVLAHQYFILSEKTGPILPPLLFLEHASSNCSFHIELS